MQTIPDIINYLFGAFEIGLVTYFTLSCIYVFVFSIAGHYYSKRTYAQSKKRNIIAVLIPAYKEDNVIIEVSNQALLQKYPKDHFDVIVIADSLKEDTIESLKKLPIKVIEVSFQNSTKAKALNYALQNMTKTYDVAVVLDADNIMEPQFLNKMNASINSGYRAIQAHRKAKNLNTPYAILDAASEEINNHIYRKGHVVLGLSSGLIGSGMVFEYNLFKSIMKSITAVGGFDKELEFELAKKKIKIEYLQNAIILDEKIQKSSDFSKQRRRWLATQFVYLNKYKSIVHKELLFKGNLNFLDKYCQMLIPPRILLLGFTTLINLLYVGLEFGWNIKLNIPSYLWLVNFLLLVIAFVLALPKTFYNTTVLRAVLTIPKVFLTMFLLLFKLKGANTKFIHTSHSDFKS